jgi:hypothetical protein
MVVFGRMPIGPLASLLMVAPMVAIVAGCSRGGELRGTIVTGDFVIPAGTVMTAQGDVTIEASRKIQIAGTLYELGTANVVFRSPVVTISGQVRKLNTRVGWWREARFSASTMPARIRHALAVRLGLTPKYWPRGQLDCFSPILGPPTDQNTVAR